MTEHDEAAATVPERRSWRWPLIVLFVIVVGGAALSGYQVLAGRRLVEKDISRATATIERADELVARVDAVVGARVRSGLESQTAEAGTLVGPARADLESAIDLLDEASGSVRGDDVDRVRLLTEAASARLEMLEQAPGILGSLSEAARALPKVESGWARVVEADAISDRAVREYNKLTKTGVRASSRLNKQAGVELVSAREEFLAAEAAFPDAGIEVYVAYVDARIKLNGLSQRSDAAWLDGRISEANDLIDSYNAGDKRAIAQAKELPSSPTSVIATAYEEATKDAREKYYAARDRAIQADKRLTGT